MKSKFKSVLVGSILGFSWITAALSQGDYQNDLSKNTFTHGDPVKSTSSYTDGECPHDKDFLSQLRQRALDEIDAKIDLRRKKCEYDVGVLSITNYDIKFIYNGQQGCSYEVTSTTACLTNP